jgi:hypothetical protein
MSYIEPTPKDLNMKFAPSINPYANLIIPETWNDVKEFADWWIAIGMPIMFPKNSEVFLSDDATAICLFRKDKFQVELYLIHPQPFVPAHEHPGVEVIKMRLGNRDIPMMSDVLKDGHSHGAGFRLEGEDKGFPLIAFQHWLEGEPSTIASKWKGPTAGPMHDSLIKRFNPTAHVTAGYADITKTQE